ncbi:MAG: class C sortase [Lachnospiraceae bacterium]|nr:class C sortase [Lachnospiraceae bacterium]
MRRRKGIGLWLPGILLIGAGIALLGYPYVSSFLRKQETNGTIQRYQQQMAEKTDLSWELKRAEEYNKSLLLQDTRFYDAFSEEEAETASEYLTLLNADEEGLMGYLQIPSISLELPIYHGTSKEVLADACGHQPGSSLPVGGPSAHVVLCGHTGLPSAKLFTNLDQMKAGDSFVLNVFGRCLEYQVDQIQIVLPDELGDLEIAEGMDYVTLMTCTPYGINSHRLLVRGARVPQGSSGTDF